MFAKRFTIIPSFILHSSLFRPSQFEVDYAFDPIANPGEETRHSREYSGRSSLQSGTSSKLDKPKLDDPHRLKENPATTTSSSTTQSTTYFASTTTTASTTSSNPSTTSGTSTTSNSSPSHRTKMTPVTTSPTVVSSTRADGSATTATNFASATPVVSLAQIAKIQNLSINEIPGQIIDRFDADVDELTEIPDILIEEGFLDTTADTVDGVPTSSQYVSTSSERTDDGKISFEDYESKFDQVQDAEVSESQHQPQQFRPRPEYRPPEAVGPEAAQGPAGESMEGQLFQDVAAKDKHQEPVLKVRGM